MNDLDAMLDQLFDGETRLWQQLSRFTDNDDQGTHPFVNFTEFFFQQKF